MPGTGPEPARVLVVDDEATIRDLLSGSLRFAGFEVVTAASGAEAVRAAACHRPDLVLLDVMMPDGDGFEVARLLGAGARGIPVVFLTARCWPPCGDVMARHFAWLCRCRSPGLG